MKYIMNNTSNKNCSDANRSIGCSVSSCKFHCKDENYCSLNSIHVGTHESDPTLDQCTDCQSFELE